MSRRESRDEALKILYAREVNGDYEPEEITEFTEKLVEGVIKHEDELDDRLKEHLDDWRIDRIYPIETVLLRTGIFEIFHTQTSKAVTINEAVELGKRYGDKDTGSFVNGILDNFKKPGKVPVTE